MMDEQSLPIETHRLKCNLCNHIEQTVWIDDVYGKMLHHYREQHPELANEYKRRIAERTDEHDWS